MTENRIFLVFQSLSCNEAFARSVVGAFCAMADPTMEELSDIKTAVSEAVTNCIVHGYPDSVGEITLECSWVSERTVQIEISDKGVGIADIKAAREPLYTTGGEERSGMGFTIMERFMTSLQVESVPGEGTKVKMLRKLRALGGNT